MIDKTNNHPKQLQSVTMPLTRNEAGIIRRIRELKAKHAQMVIVEIRQGGMLHCREVGKLEGQKG
jgi:hypothetical protein